MNIKLNIKKEIINQVYLPYLTDYSKRYEVYYGSAGSGKSVFITQKIIIKALKQRRRVLVARKTAKSNEASTFKLFLDILSQFKLLSLCKINRTTQKITLPNNSEIMFVGLDDVEKLKSITGITDIFIEEATEINKEDFLQLNLRLRALVDNLQVFISFNPVSKANWVYKIWFAEGAEVDYETTRILKTTYKDNKFLPEDYINAIESYKETDYTYYKIYALGEFASLDKLVFNNWELGTLSADTTEKWELCIGLDWGFVNDKTALICSLLDEESRTLYIFDAWGDIGYTNDRIARVIEEKGYKKSLIIADSAEQKSIEEVRECGIGRIKPAKKGKGSIIQGIQKLKQYKIIINPELDEVIEEFQNYSWKKNKDGEYINEPIDSFNHYIDALRYSLQCSKNRLKTINKNVL